MMTEPKKKVRRFSVSIYKDLRKRRFVGEIRCVQKGCDHTKQSPIILKFYYPESANIDFKAEKARLLRRINYQARKEWREGKRLSVDDVLPHPDFMAYKKFPMRLARFVANYVRAEED